LPEAVAAAAYKLITGPLLEQPHRVGKQLLPPLGHRLKGAPCGRIPPLRSGQTLDLTTHQDLAPVRKTGDEQDRAAERDENPMRAHLRWSTAKETMATE
jgi:hypothetical protein